MANAIRECIDDIIKIADSSQPDRSQRTQAEACIQWFFHETPKAIPDLQDALTMAASDRTTSPEARQLLAEMRVVAGNLRKSSSRTGSAAGPWDNST